MKTRFNSAACLAVTALLSALVVSGAHGPVRAVLAVAFYLAVPGWAVVGWLRLDDEALRWSLAIGTSVAIGILSAQATLLAHLWNPSATFAVLASISAALLAGQLVREAQA
jgi:hypothetical protein